MSEHDNALNNDNQTDLLGQAVGLDDQYYLNVYGRRQMLLIVSGEGAWLTGSDGKRYLDLIGGIAVSVLGHAHPRLVKAICEQAGRVIHCSNYFYNGPQARLAERLAVLSGLDGARVFFGNSGSEANEAAIKLARAYFHHQGAPRAKIVSALKSFHGRTLATATATGQDKYSAPFAPLPAGFVHVPYNDIGALEQAVDQETCAVLLEVIQGESGVIPANTEYLKAAEALCRQTGARLIIDEIQTGMGRTGRFLAHEHAGIRPDMVTLAKGLAGGVPIGAMIANAQTAAGFNPGDHGTTFGGNPLACAAALAVLDTYEQDRLIERAASVGAALKQQLLDLAQRLPAIAEIRGLGLMLGIGLAFPVAQAIKASMLKKGFLVGSVGDTTIRLLPPLIVEPDDLALFVRAFGETVAELAPQT